MKRSHLHQSQALAVAASLASVLLLSSASALADDSSWSPVSSEQLVRMPASYLDKYVEQDFRDSALSSRIVEIDEGIAEQLQHMKGLHESIEQTSGEPLTELRHQLLVAKSDYLDLIEEKQSLDRNALDKKAGVYERVLSKLKRSKRRTSDPVSAQLVADQEAARQRMEQSVAMVDQVLAMSPTTKQSRYAEQYGDNLARIEELKTVIVGHVANAGPAVDGEEVTREEFVRHLLTNIDAERSILDQEQLMLGYMAKLVALDAHMLEQEVALGIDLDKGGSITDRQPERLADATDLFIE